MDCLGLANNISDTSKVAANSVGKEGSAIWQSCSILGSMKKQK